MINHPQVTIFICGISIIPKWIQMVLVCGIGHMTIFWWHVGSIIVGSLGVRPQDSTLHAVYEQVAKDNRRSRGSVGKRAQHDSYPLVIEESDGKCQHFS